MTARECTLVIDQANISAVDLNELFDVHVQARLHLAGGTGEANKAKRTSAKIKIVAHQP